MRLQGWKTVATGALIGSLGWGAANGVFGADGFGGWNALDDSAVVLTTDAGGELSDEVGRNDGVEENDADGGDVAGSVDFAGGDLGALADETAALRAELAALREETAALKVDFETAKAKEAEEAAKKKDSNGPFSVNLGGQMIFDATHTSANDKFTGFYGDPSNMWNFRDVRLTVRGSGYGNLEYVSCVSFSDRVRFLDFYLRYKDSKYLGDITFGQFFVESGMESTAASFDKLYAMADENAILFRMNRRVGVSSTRFGSDKRVRLFSGVFLPKLFNTEPFATYDDNQGAILNARLSGTPIYREDEDGFLRELAHLGGSYYWVSPGSDGATQAVRTRGLGWTSSSPYFLDGTLDLADRSFSVTQMEAAWQREGFATTADGYVKSVEDGGNMFGTTLGASWILTPGVTRLYSKDMGRFAGLKMPSEARFLNWEERRVGKNWGAWEVLGKWSWTEANDLREAKGATFGTVNRLTVGASWYWNERTYWKLNWERAFVDAQRGGETFDSSVDSLILQAAVKF